jgi:hypothetical protein
MYLCIGFCFKSNSKFSMLSVFFLVRVGGYTPSTPKKCKKVAVAADLLSTV